jgi:hypothetical protein
MLNVNIWHSNWIKLAHFQNNNVKNCNWGWEVKLGPKGKGILPAVIGTGISHPVANSLAFRYLGSVPCCRSCCAFYQSRQEFGAEKPISWVKLTHCDVFAINFTVWSHILSTVGHALTRQQGYINMVQSWKSVAYWSLLLLELSPNEKSAQESNLWMAITHWILTPLSVTKEANSDHQIQQSHWLETKIFRLTHWLILLNIENNGPFLSFPLFLWNSHKRTEPHYTINYWFTQVI